MYASNYSGYGGYGGYGGGYGEWIGGDGARWAESDDRTLTMICMRDCAPIVQVTIALS